MKKKLVLLLGIILLMGCGNTAPATVTETKPIEDISENIVVSVTPQQEENTEDQTVEVDSETANDTDEYYEEEDADDQEYEYTMDALEKEGYQILPAEWKTVYASYDYKDKHPDEIPEDYQDFPYFYGPNLEEIDVPVCKFEVYTMEGGGILKDVTYEEDGIDKMETLLSMNVNDNYSDVVVLKKDDSGKYYWVASETASEPVWDMNEEDGIYTQTYKIRISPATNEEIENAKSNSTGQE